MPELPEVETVRRILKEKLINKTIRDVKIYWDNIIKYPNKKDFIFKIKNQTIHDISRRGKWLIFELNDCYLLSHLRMEGKFFFKNQNEQIIKHEHVIILFDDFELRYSDTRKFGVMYLIKKEEINITGPISRLGPEPFDEQLTSKYLKGKFKNGKKVIKSSLLDQNIIAGIGNIYVDEILFLSKISPFEIVGKLNKKELQNIIDNTKQILSKSILMGGTTIRTYTSSLGVTGRFQDELLVHQRKDKACKICGSLIKKVKVGGRGTYFCDRCQRLKN